MLNVFLKTFKLFWFALIKNNTHTFFQNQILIEHSKIFCQILKKPEVFVRY